MSTSLAETRGASRCRRCAHGLIGPMVVAIAWSPGGLAGQMDLCLEVDFQVLQSAQEKFNALFRDQLATFESAMDSIVLREVQDFVPFLRVTQTGGCEDLNLPSQGEIIVGLDNRGPEGGKLAYFTFAFGWRIDGDSVPNFEVMAHEKAVRGLAAQLDPLNSIAAWKGIVHDVFEKAQGQKESEFFSENSLLGKLQLGGTSTTTNSIPRLRIQWNELCIEEGARTSRVDVYTELQPGVVRKIGTVRLDTWWDGHDQDPHPWPRGSEQDFEQYYLPFTDFFGAAWEEVERDGVRVFPRFSHFANSDGRRSVYVMMREYQPLASCMRLP